MQYVLIYEDPAVRSWRAGTRARPDQPGGGAAVPRTATARGGGRRGGL